MLHFLNIYITLSLPGSGPSCSAQAIETNNFALELVSQNVRQGSTTRKRSATKREGC